MHEETEAIVASLVPEHSRLGTLPRFFGVRQTMRAEALVYRWMDVLCAAYDGGYWHYYTLSNGGFYMAPDLKKPVLLAVDGNGFEAELSPDAAGIVASLFAQCSLAAQTEEDRHIELYHALRAYALEHAEARLILAAID